MNEPDSIFIRNECDTFVPGQKFGIVFSVSIKILTR